MSRVLACILHRLFYFRHLLCATHPRAIECQGRHGGNYPVELSGVGRTYDRIPLLSIDRAMEHVFRHFRQSVAGEADEGRSPSGNDIWTKHSDVVIYKSIYYALCSCIIGTYIICTTYSRNIRITDVLFTYTISRYISKNKKYHWNIWSQISLLKPC